MLKPWFLIPTKWAHDLAPIALQIGLPFLKTAGEKPFQWRGLTFRNRYSIAGGVDKNASSLPAWKKMGLGFVEIGTVTPKPQQANPGKIMDREIGQMALWNKMGFPNHGADRVLAAIEKQQPLNVPLLINIGKNRDTDNAEAERDYKECADKLSSVADIFVVNISSPNTKGLRDLQNAEAIRRIIGAVGASGKPVLLKLSPDMPEKSFTQLLMSSVDAGVSGWILTNTTQQKENTQFTHEGGGVSGLPLREKSRRLLQMAVATLKDIRQDRLIISAGGITDPAEARLRLQLGADLIETYSGLIYYGPSFFKDCVALEGNAV